MRNTLFISDLHLSADQPLLIQAFVHLVQTLAPNYEMLYILGDWFEAWIGDDDDSEWLGEIVSYLQQLQQQGTQVSFLPGNRDFLLGQAFMDRFGGQLLHEVTVIDTAAGKIRLEHGDLLCTDDEKYQQFRQLSRNPQWQSTMLDRPLEERKQIAQFMRMQSKLTQKAMDDIVDVNHDAVLAALGGHDILLHGHTHRPAVHPLANGQRVVLGDWRTMTDTAGKEYVTAQIATLNDNRLALSAFNYPAPS